MAHCQAHDGPLIGQGARPIGPAWRAGLLLPAALVILVVVPVAASKTISPPPAQPLARVGHATLGESNLPQVADCTGCHSDATQQWRSSLHAQAVTDEYYLAVATLFIEERGVEALRYCAACHNPVGLMRGEVDIQCSSEAFRRQRQPGV